MPDAQPIADHLPGRPGTRLHPGAPNPFHPRPWRRDSVFGDGPRRPLSADERRQWLARVDGERRAWRLTALQERVAEALVKRLSVDGQCDPSHATLAADVECDPSTVGRALNALRDAGMLTWERRLVRRAWPAGGRGAQRAEQTSNAYELLLPARPVAPREQRRCSTVRLRPDCDRQPARETPSQYVLGGFVMPSEAEMERVRTLVAARKARLDVEWLAQRAERWRGRG